MTKIRSASSRALRTAVSEVFELVADDDLSRNVEPEVVQPAGQVEGVRILKKGSQELGSDGQDVDVHRIQPDALKNQGAEQRRPGRRRP